MTVQLDIVVLKLALRKEKSVVWLWVGVVEVSILAKKAIMFTVKLHSCL